ncbi:MAG: hypothetical protein AB7T37_02215 [Dehalococcoidia bacterium]
MTNDMVSRLGNAMVLDTEGQPVRLGSRWEEKPIVLAMIRHFG